MITSSANKVIVAGNGAQTVFGFGFVGAAATDISAIFTDASGNETVLVQGPGPAQFQVSLNAAAAGALWGVGGTVTYNPGGVPIAGGTTLTIFREIAYTQGVSLQNQASYGQYAQAAETAMDLLEMQIQQIAEAQTRVVSAPIVDPDTISLTLPPAAQRANSFLGFDGEGNVIAGTTPATGIISSAMQPVVSAATLAAGRAAFGLGTIATENFGAAGTALEDIGDGNARVVFPVDEVAASQAPARANHLTRYVSTGSNTFTLAQAATFFNGFGFWVSVVSGSVTFTPAGSDQIQSGALGASGASLTVAAPASVFISTDGAAVNGIWYADVLYPSALSGFGVQKSAAYSVVATDNGTTHYLTGSNSFTVSVAAASGFPATFKLRWYNQSSRGILLSISGITSFFLYPGQSANLEKDGGGWNVAPLVQRYTPSGIVTVFVDNAGSDSNDGLAAGATGAFATIQHALDVARASFDVLGSGLTVQLADGTYNVGAGINMNYLMPLRDFQILGDAANSANVVVSCSAGGSCFNARDGATTCTLGAMTLSTTGNGSNLLSVSQNAVVDLGAFNGVNFNAAPLGIHITVSTWASSNFESGYTVNGGAGNHIFVRNNAFINYGSFNVTGASGLAFTVFAGATDGGVINAGGVAMAFTGFGGVTGQKYSATLNGVIDSAGTVYPGGTAGSTASGGQYD